MRDDIGGKISISTAHSVRFDQMYGVSLLRCCTGGWSMWLGVG